MVDNMKNFFLAIKNNRLFRRHAVKTIALFLTLVCCWILITAGAAFAQDAKKTAAHQNDTMKLGSVMLPSAFLDQVVRVAKSDGGALVFADPKGKLVIAERTGDRFKADFWTQDAFVLAARWVVDHGEPLVIEGGSNNVLEGLKPIPDYLQSYLGYPLKQGSKVFGVVNLVRMYGKDNFSETDMDVVELIVAQSADAVERLKEQSIKDLVQNREISAKTKVYFAPDESVIREKSISLELGLNFLPASTPIYVSDTINNQGMNIGILVPIRVPHALLWYRVKALFHGTRSYRGNQNYVTGVNEILGGKSLRIKSIPFEYTPLLGIGFNNGIILQNMFKAGFMGAAVHYYWHYNIGFIVREQYRVKDVHLAQGLLVNFERAFIYDDNSKMRFNVSLIMSY
jgi:hypothetical protein